MPASVSLAATEAPLAADRDLLMFDLDGVIYRGARAVPHAVEAVAAARAFGPAAAFLTNNASRTATEVAEHLCALGVTAGAADVVTAAQAIAHIVAAAVPTGSAVLVVGGPGLREPLEQLGLRCVESAADEPTAVVQGFHPDVGWRNLAEASYAIAAGVPWFASNTDLTVPTGRGTAPGNGALVEAVKRATGATPVVAGKPEAGIFTETLGRTGATRPLMVGDRLDTDILGAARLGIDSLQVLTGVHGLADVAGLPIGERPSFVGADLRALLAVHPPVSVFDGRATCAEAVAEVVEETISLVAGVAGSVPAIRAVVELAWAVLDATGRPARLAADALEH